MTMSEPTGPHCVDVLRAMAGAAVLLRNDGVVVALNDSFLDEFAADDAYSETITGARLAELADSLDATVIEPLRQATRCERLALRGVKLWKHGSKNGERFDVSISRVDESHSLVQFTATGDDMDDVGERRRLKRLECLGMAASGVAHDLANHLSASINVASLLAEELGPDSPHVSALEIIRGSSQEAATLARRLLSFAGYGQSEIRKLDLPRIVADAALLVNHELPKDGRLQIDVAADPISLSGDETQIQHAALLLLLRSSKRVSPAGYVRVRSQSLNIAKPLSSAFQRRLPVGEYVVLDFLHTCSEETSAELSADEILSTVDAIAHEHGGALMLGREGDKDLVRLMLARSTTPKRTPPPTPAEAPTVKGRVVLVADDDPMVRSVAVAMLHRLGHRTVIAHGGREAIDLFRKGDPPVDLVLLDVVMNDVDGPTVLRTLKGIDPDVKVVVSSGFGPQLPIPQDLTISATLEKPYTLTSLKSVLDRVLAGEVTPALAGDRPIRDD